MAASAAPAQEAPGEQRPSLLGALKDAGQFNTLARLLDATGLSEVLESEARFTLLAPTDEAFRLLSESMLDAARPILCDTFEVRLDRVERELHLGDPMLHLGVIDHRTRQGDGSLAL